MVMFIRTRWRHIPHSSHTPGLGLVAVLLLTAGSAIGQGKESVGVTLAARGEVAATDLVALKDRMLRRRSKIFNVDRIATGAGARAQMRMADNALISLRENSELVIAEYQFNAETGEGRAIMELVAGGLRTLSGQIAPDTPGSSYELRTLAGSIGIRGTHYEVFVDGANTLFGVWDGNIDVEPPQGEPFSLGEDGDYSFASVGGDGDVDFLLEPPEQFSDDLDGDDENPDESTDQGQDESQNEDQEQEPDEEQEESQEESSEESQDGEEEAESDEQSAGDETDSDTGEPDEPAGGDNTNEASDDTGDTPTAPLGEPQVDESQGTDPAETNAGISDELLAVLNTSAVPPASPPEQTNRPDRNPDALGDRIDSAQDQLPVDLVPTAPARVAERTGFATYSNPDFTLDGGLTDYHLEMVFNVDFQKGRVPVDGILSLRSANELHHWSGRFEGGFEGNTLAFGSHLNNNHLNQARYNGQLLLAGSGEYGWLNGQLFGPGAGEIRGDFGFVGDFNNLDRISGDYRIREDGS